MVQSANRCVYKGCCNCKRNNPELSFHRIPIDDLQITEQWILHSGNEDLMTLEIPALNYRRICSNHFDEKYFIKTSTRVRLDKRAVPKDWRVEASHSIVEYDASQNDDHKVPDKTFSRTTVCKKNAEQIIRRLRRSLLKSQRLLQKYRKENRALRQLMVSYLS